MSSPDNSRIKPALQSWLERTLLFLLLFAIIFSFPHRPVLDLDASWRMALGKFFLDGLQFGRDVVFTYGPLGFLMGKTYSGLLFWSLIAWQVIASGFIAGLIQYWGQRLPAGWPRLFFYAAFLLYGVTYEDAMHMLVIALIGFELLRRVDEPWHWSSSLLLLFLATQGVAKFTNLMLGAIMVGAVISLALWRRRGRTALHLGGWFAGGYLAGWVLCGQNPLNLPVYFLNSFYVSEGYNEVMGIESPADALWKAMAVNALLAAYILLNVFTAKDRARSVAGGVMLGAFLFLNWKHGFVRSDGHMVGHFYCALLPVVGFPVLLGDAVPFGRLKRWGLVAAGVLCMLGIRDAIPPLVDSALAILQNKAWTNVTAFSRLTTMRDDYDTSLFQEVQRWSLPRTAEVVGQHSIDVLGYNQAVAIYNKFNYRPRPVFQSYSAYTPELARLNLDFYTSPRAPDYVLVQVNSIDQRLPIMDDSAVFYALTHRYSYVLSEKSFQLWRKNQTPFDPSTLPRPLETKTLALEELWSIKSYNSQPLWVKIVLRPSLLGRLRNFFYKPPLLHLAVVDSKGKTTTYLMPAPIGRAGFIINPVIDDLMDFTHFSSGTPERLTEQLMVTLRPEDRKYFAATARIELSALTYSTAGQDFFRNLTKEQFYMFKSTPVAFESNNKPSNEKIGDTQVMVLHAPSEMVFDLPKNATVATGRFGFLPGAYTNGGRTNGAEFLIVWSDGKDTVELFRKFLNPLTVPEDRGLQELSVDLHKLTGGRLYFRTLPGPYNDFGWDWTGWTEIDIK